MLCYGKIELLRVINEAIAEEIIIMDCFFFFPLHDKAMSVPITDKQITDIQHKINRRPREKLNFKRPKNLFYKKDLRI